MPKDTQKLESLKHRCYLITNLANGKVYVGTTHKSIEERFREHIKTSKLKNSNSHQAIHKAIIKHGADRFKVELLSEYDTATQAYDAEIKYIQQYNSRNNKIGYNQSEGGDRGPQRIKYTRKIIIKIITDFCDGMLLKDIAVKYHLSYYSVFDITRLKISNDHNLPQKLLQRLEKFKESSKKKKRASPQISQIINEFLGGFTMQQLANKYNFSINTVWNIIHRIIWTEIKIESSLEDRLREKLSSSRYWKTK